MRRREFIGLIGGRQLGRWPRGHSNRTKIPRIGVLWQAGSVEAQADLPSFRAGFKDVGYSEGDLIFEDRFWDSGSRGSLERLDSFAKELVDLKCDVLVGVAIASALALRRHTSTIPIVFVYNPNPAGSGLVKSLNRPGGNVTGVTQVHVDLAAKRVELLKDTIPGLSSLAMIYDLSPPLQFANRPELDDTRRAANQLGLLFESFECDSPEGLAEAVSKASRLRAAILGNSHWIFLERKRLAELAIAGKLAVMGPASLMVEAGLLMSYGANWWTVARSAAPLVKKILQGEKPENIPVRQPTTFELVFNLKTADAIGLQIPPIMLARATSVIE